MYWKNLLQNRCPRCRKYLDFIADILKCKHCQFFIDQDKAQRIINEIEERKLADIAPPLNELDFNE